jgi:hypothetical protein
MIISTTLSLFIVPVLYVIIGSLRDKFTDGSKNTHGRTALWSDSVNLNPTTGKTTTASQASAGHEDVD